MIIIGLGNPGRRYARTRHNLGWLVLDEILTGTGGKWKKENNSLVAKINAHWLVKPAAFMNHSGPIVAEFLRRHKLTDRLDQVVVVHDDLDLPLGQIRRQFNRGPAGHRGVESIIAALGTRAFGRYRIGLGSNRTEARDIAAEDYVLRDIPAAEWTALEPVVKTAAAELRTKLE